MKCTIPVALCTNMSNMAHDNLPKPTGKWFDIERYCAPIDPSVWIIGLTTHRRVEPCHYLVFGDYTDRWGRGNMTLRLTHWRQMTEEEHAQYLPLMKGGS